MKSRFDLAIAAIASVATVLAVVLSYYQFFADASNDDIVAAILREENPLQEDVIDGYSESDVREIVAKLDEATQVTAKSAADRGIDHLPVIYLKEGGVTVEQNDEATFRTPSGAITIFGVNSVHSSYAVVSVDGFQKRVKSGDVLPSSRDPQCDYLIGKLGQKTVHIGTVAVRLVCDGLERKQGNSVSLSTFALLIAEQLRQPDAKLRRALRASPQFGAGCG